MISIALTTLVSLPGAVSADGAFGNDIVQMIAGAGLMVKFVLLVLCLFSLRLFARLMGDYLSLRVLLDSTLKETSLGLVDVVVLALKMGW